MASKTKDFFETGNSAQFEWVLALYDQCLRLKAEAKSSKPDNVIKLDKWYQNDLPKKIKSRGRDAHLTHEEMVQTIKWKLARGKFRPNLVNLVQMNTPRVILQDTKKAFRKLAKTDGDVQAAAAILCNLKGVGPAMASAVLAAGAPELAPFMADECLLAMPDVDSLDYTMKEYMNYVEHVKGCVERLNQQGGSWNPHKVELAIWTYYIAMDLKPELLSDLPSAAECAAAAAAAAAEAADAAAEAADAAAAAAPAPTADEPAQPATAAVDNSSEAAKETPTTSPQPKEASAVQPHASTEEAPTVNENANVTEKPSNGSSSEDDAKTDAKADENTSQQPEMTSSNAVTSSSMNGQQTEKKNGHSEEDSSLHEQQSVEPSVTTPVNGTNGNGVATKEELSAAAVTNGSSEKRENGTTKLSEAVPTAAAAAAAANNGENSGEKHATAVEVLKRSAASADGGSSCESAAKKIRTEDTPTPAQEAPGGGAAATPVA